MLRAQPPFFFLGEGNSLISVFWGRAGTGMGAGEGAHSLRENSSCAATVPSITLGLMRRVHSPSASVV